MTGPDNPEGDERGEENGTGSGIRRRDVMKAAGATTVGGLMTTGTTTATEPSGCNCEGGFLGSNSACLTGRIGCMYCKIDSGDLPSVGSTCSVDGTDSGTIERTSDQCIDFSDPDHELCKIASRPGVGRGRVQSRTSLAVPRGASVRTTIEASATSSSSSTARSVPASARAAAERKSARTRTTPSRQRASAVTR